jgi:hypothetical protein
MEIGVNFLPLKVAELVPVQFYFGLDQAKYPQPPRLQVYLGFTAVGQHRKFLGYELAGGHPDALALVRRLFNLTWPLQVPPRFREFYST